MFNIGGSELILILLIAFLVVGPKDLPKIGRALGRGVKYVRGIVREIKKETGLDEVEGMVKDIGRDLKEIGNAADVSGELKELRKAADMEGEWKDIRRDIEKTVKDAYGSVQDEMMNGGTET